MHLKQLNDISKAVDGVEVKITEIQGEIEGIEKVSGTISSCSPSLMCTKLPYYMVGNFGGDESFVNFVLICLRIHLC